MEKYFLIAAFVIIGMPIVGYGLRMFIRGCKYVYRNFPVVQKLFDYYWENWGIGLIVTLVALIIWLVLHASGVL